VTSIGTTAANPQLDATDAAGSAGPADVIEDLRAEIDRLDNEIAQLVAERARVSVRVQAARVHAGGTRIELGRERVIFEHYRSTLGHDGPALAEAVLRICRGQR
jgi:chorismate mutase